MTPLLNGFTIRCIRTPSMSFRRPILSVCLVVAIFATGGMGVAGGRVICVGDEGHLAVAGARDHGTQSCHECCAEAEPPGGHSSVLAREADCVDWSLDAQGVERPSGPSDAEGGAGAVAPPALIIGAGLGLGGFERLPHSSTVHSGEIPRAHLTHLSSVILLI